MAAVPPRPHATARAVPRSRDGALLHDWLADLSTAPGRAVSSPWADHITITTVAFRGADACTVGGRLVERSSAYVDSGTNDASSPVTLQLRRLPDGRWLISGYSEGE